MNHTIKTDDLIGTNIQLAADSRTKKSLSTFLSQGVDGKWVWVYRLKYKDHVKFYLDLDDAIQLYNCIEFEDRE
jgi:hypothetical protein